MDSIKKTYPIRNDYTINENVVLGIGVSGKVFLCVHNLTGERFALKVCVYLNIYCG